MGDGRELATQIVPGLERTGGHTINDESDR